MRIRRRSLRKLLIAVGCVVANVGPQGALVGGGLLLGGSVLHLWSRGCLEQNRNLTTVGPYRWTRNPFYLANLLIDIGLCFIIGRGWVAAIFLPIWWLAYRETMKREETRLLELFPEAYSDYRRSVPRLIPTGRRLPAEHGRGRFSWKNPALAQGAEYARLMGVFLAPGLIWAGQILRHEGLGIFEDSNSTLLGLIVFLPCAWVVKLALAERFRRPETALLPFGSTPLLRHGVTVLLLGAAIFFGRPWAASLPALWCGLIALDRWGRARIAPANPSKRTDWQYFPRIAFVSVTMYGLLAVWTRSAAG